jgi:hypothetical protein
MLLTDDVCTVTVCTVPRAVADGQCLQLFRMWNTPRMVAMFGNRFTLDEISAIVQSAPLVSHDDGSCTTKPAQPPAHSGVPNTIPAAALIVSILHAASSVFI